MLKSGDVVTLKSDTSKMTIEKIDGEIATCIKIIGDKRIEFKINVDLLKKHERRFAKTIRYI